MRSNTGTLAQLVEQRTENPCVPSSILGGTTQKNRIYLTYKILRFSFFYRVLIRVFERLKTCKNSNSSLITFDPYNIGNYLYSIDGGWV